jgi:hypothetical protein
MSKALRCTLVALGLVLAVGVELLPDEVHKPVAAPPATVESKEETSP